MRPGLLGVVAVAGVVVLIILCTVPSPDAELAGLIGRRHRHSVVRPERVAWRRHPLHPVSWPSRVVVGMGLHVGIGIVGRVTGARRAGRHVRAWRIEHFRGRGVVHRVHAWVAGVAWMSWMMHLLSIVRVGRRHPVGIHLWRRWSVRVVVLWSPLGRWVVTERRLSMRRRALVVMLVVRVQDTWRIWKLRILEMSASHLLLLDTPL